MERDIFDLGKNIVNGIFSGSTLLNILGLIGISVAGMLLKAFLERIKESNPRLAYLILGILFLFILYLVVSEFHKDHLKKDVQPEKSIDEQLTTVTDSTSEFQEQNPKTDTPSEEKAEDEPVKAIDSTSN